MLRPGLVSVTFRHLCLAEVARLAAQAGLEGIEWGGDIHVPHGDLARAREARHLTIETGLAVAAYGSYYRAVESEEEGLSFGRVLETALELGAPVCRVWAGKRWSSLADDLYRTKVEEDLRRVGEMAAEAGVVVACEFHGGTLTDTNESALALMSAVAHRSVGICWQPGARSPDEPYQRQGLRKILPWLVNLHVFHWTAPPIERRPLEEGESLWKPRLQIAAEAPRDLFALLEFVQDNAPERLLADAKALRRMLAEMREIAE